MEADGYGSHIRVFEKLFEEIPIRSVLEFGMGLFSTPFFTDRCEFVVSVEQDSRDWYDQTVAASGSPRWVPIFEPDPQAVFERFDREGVAFDAVLSDGRDQTRRLAANLAMRRRVPFVILHDAEKIWYYSGICWRSRSVTSGLTSGGPMS